MQNNLKTYAFSVFSQVSYESNFWSSIIKENFRKTGIGCERLSDTWFAGRPTTITVIAT